MPDNESHVTNPLFSPPVDVVTVVDVAAAVAAAVLTFAPPPSPPSSTLRLDIRLICRRSPHMDAARPKDAVVLEKKVDE